MTTRPARVPGRVIAWTALLFALGASVGANIGAARPELGPRLVAPVAPVIALLGAALLERIDLRGTRWWQRAAIGGGLVLVVALAFVTSYQHQQSLLLAYGNLPLSADLLPVAVDVLVLMASVALAVIGQQRRTAREQVEPVPAPAPVAVPAVPPAVVERVDPLGLLTADVPEPAAEDPGTPEPAPEPVPAEPAAKRRPPVPDRQILRLLADPDRVPRRPDGTVAVRDVERRWGCRQDRAIRLLGEAGLYREGEGESVPGDVDEDVPADRELEDVTA
jgi:hypothetical protein